jgi:drug/metabolite transporter (DMT)-like permease
MPADAEPAPAAQQARATRAQMLPTHPRPALLYLAVGLMVVSWTINLPIGKVALVSFPPLLLISLRTVLAALLILPAFVWANPGSRRIALGDVPGLIRVCLIAQVGNQVLFVIGLDNTSVSHAAFIFSLAPILVLLLAAAVRQEHFTSRKLVGMFVSAAGVILLSMDKANGGGPTLFGDATILASAFTFSFFTVMSKPYRERYGAVTVATFAYVSGAAALLPVVLYFVWEQGFPFGEVAASGWTALLYMAVFPAVIGYVIYYYALGYIAASRLSAFTYLQPPLATLLGVVFLDEPLTSLLLLGGTLILVGVALTERS